MTKKEQTTTDVPAQNQPDNQPDFGKILLATVAGILILGGITYAGYRYSQSKTEITSPSIGDCSNCVGGTLIRFDGWDLNDDGVINSCSEACRAYWGPDCNGDSYCGNPGSTDPGICCTCLTTTGDSCTTLSPPPSPTSTASPTPKEETSPTPKETTPTP